MTLSRVLLVLVATLALSATRARAELPEPPLQERDNRLLDEAFGRLAPQRPGVTDLYVVGFGGDSEEDVFRNEVDYLETLMTSRFQAGGRVVSLVNHTDSLFRKPRPLATLPNLRKALAGVAARMDRDEDVLMLFLTMHGTPTHELAVRMQSRYLALITPDDLRKALDDAGIRNRVVVISACYSGGFVPALSSPDALVLTASHRNRPSFGCGADSKATYFGRAWMIEALNETSDFAAAFELAKTRIASRERAQGFRPSRPQIAAGANIGARLKAWQASFTPGAPVPYPWGGNAEASAAAGTQRDGNARTKR